MKKYLLIVGFLSLTVTSYSQNWDEVIKLTASDAEQGDFFGYNVSISGNIAIVGAYFDDDNGISSGSAYIFELEGGIWIEKQKLLASDADEGDHFGESVSISDNIAIIGASWNNDPVTRAGSAYIFEKEDGVWIEKQKLLASDGEDLDHFGGAVSISGNQVIVGCANNDDNGTLSGSAYIFEKEGNLWVEKQNLLASDGDEQNRFGHSVAMSSDIVIIGIKDNNDTATGTAYIFEKEDGVWIEKQKLLASDGMENDLFGFSVDISGEIAIVGASGKDDPESNTGAAYIFEKENDIWVEKQILLASDGSIGDTFGASVSISENTVIVGSHWNDDSGSNSGSAYIFEMEGDVWVEKQKLLASDAEGNDQFGHSVSVSGSAIFIGAIGNNQEGQNSGAVYVYDLEETSGGISLVKTDHSLSIYPNPSDGAFTITTEENNLQITFYTMDGKLVKECTANQNSITISALESGIYLLKVQSENGHSTSQRIVVY